MKVTVTGTLWDGFLKVVNARVWTKHGLVDREVIQSRDSVAVLLIHAERRTVMMVEQPRAGVLMHVDLPIREIPAGMIDADETPEQAANREVLEEVGIIPYSTEKMGFAFLAPGTSSEICHLFLAFWTDNDRVTDGGGVASEHEDIHWMEVPLAEITDPRNLRDMKTMAAIFRYYHRSPHTSGI